MNPLKGASLVTGVVMLVIGLVFCLFPSSIMSFFTALVGLALLVMSISAIYTWAKGMKGSLLGTGVLVMGIIGLICGFTCLFQPLATASTITWLVALCVVVMGGAQLISLVFATGLPGRGVALAGAALVVIFGICAMVRPAMVVQFIGIALLVEGVSVVLLSFLGDRA